jgi:hypothetical protein
MGASASVLSYGEALAHAISHPHMVIQAPLRSWLDTKVSNLIPLTSLWMREPHQLGKYSVGSAPPGYQNTWRWGPCTRRTPSDNPDRFEGSMSHQLKSKTLHMKLSLRLSFQLSHNLRGYPVGTTAGFWVTTIEVLGPWSHLQILWWHP